MKHSYLFVLFTLSVFQSCQFKKELVLRRTNAINYLESSEFAVDYTYVYSYLSRKYDLPYIKQLSQIEEYKDSLWVYKDEKYCRPILSQMYLFKKLINPEHKISQEESLVKNINQITLMGLYFNDLKLDEQQYFNALEIISKVGEYHTTHTLFSMILYEDNILHKSKEFKKKKKLLQKRNIKVLLDNSNKNDDLKMEIIAFLLESKGKVKKSWIKKVLKEQNIDGGWSKSQLTESSSTHTTTLAIWVLSNLIQK